MRGSQRLRALLSDPIFLRLWVMGVLGNVARWLEMLVIGVFAVDTTGSPLLVALLVMLRMAPLAVFGSIVGTYADRIRPRLLLSVSLVVAIFMSAAVLALALSGIAEYWHVAIATFVSGLVWCTDMPVRRRILGDAAGEGQIVPAMSLDSASNNATRMIGPLFGGILYQMLDMGGAFALTTALYGVCLFLVLGLPANVSERVQTGTPTKLLRDFQEAFRFVARDRDRDVLRILLVTVVFNIWGLPFISMIPVIGREELGLSAGWIGTMAALEGCGAFLGALLIALSGRVGASRRFYFFGTLGYLIFAFVVGWMGDVIPVSVFILCVGLSASGFSTMQGTLIYSVAPPEMRGRLFGLLVLCIGTGLLGFANIGLMGELFGGATAIKIVAAEGLIPLFLIAIGWRKLWRRAD